MNRSRAVLTAAAATMALTFAGTAATAGSSLSAGPASVASVPPTVFPPGDPRPVPEPVSPAFLGIGITSLITFRRFRKMFN